MRNWIWTIRMTAGRHRRGVTLVEVLVVLGILAVSTAMMLPAVQRARSTSWRTTCQNNLRQVGHAMQTYRDNNQDRFPDAARLPTLEPRRYSLTQVLFDYAGGDTTRFRCPLDATYFDSEGVSYEYPQPKRGPSGQTLEELQKAWKDAPLQLIWLSYDFEPVHNPKGASDNRSFLFADGHVH